MSIIEAPVVMELPVIWADQDLFGHVNNTVFLRWFESSRVTYWDASGLRGLMEPHNLGPILARAHCDYKHQIHYPDMIQVSARIERLGNTSMAMHHELVSEQADELAAVGSSVVVLFDYKSQKPVRIPEEIRAAIRQFESDAKL